ncbi:MAG TPA: nuclear transport factor 2 family protein [Pyrinomonadaceae bacterium]|nr:nuclear transport factor 2 family protein [Pyrinomonadaceae bacterium]
MKKYAIILILLLTAFAANAQQKNPFQEKTEVAQVIATQYFNHYMAIDWDKLGALMHDDITFDDVTAELLFGEKKPVGKENVLKNFRDTFVAITNMTPKLTRTFFSGSIGVFEMDLSFSFKNRQNGITTITMPLVVVITVKDGKVISHRDYGDYREYLKQLRALQEKTKN